VHTNEADTRGRSFHIINRFGLIDAKTQKQRMDGKHDGNDNTQTDISKIERNENHTPKNATRPCTTCTHVVDAVARREKFT
jgi:hypothetical protein